MNQNPQILIFEDPKTDCQSVYKNLTDLRAVFLAVRNTSNWSVELKSFKPDLILLSSLFDGNGFEICRQIKKSPEGADLPVIFLMKEGEIEKRHQVFSSGGTDYILLPTDLKEISVRIHSHLRGKGTYRLSEEGQTLTETEDTLQLIFDSMSEGIALNEIIYNEILEMTDYRILKVNQAFYRQADYKGTEVIGELATSLYGMSSDFIKDFWKNHLKNNKPISVEMFSPIKNRCFIITTSPFFNNYFITSFFDITERKQMEVSLKESNIKFQSLAENIIGHLAYINADTFLYEFVNEAYERTFTIPKDQFIGRHMKDIIGEEKFQFAFPYFQQAKEGKSVSYENTFELDTGKHWAQVNYSPMFGSDGKVSAVAVLSYDITEHKRTSEELRIYRDELEKLVQERTAELQNTIADQKLAEEALRESEERIRAIFNAAGVAIGLTDVQGKWLKANYHWQTLLGYSVSELQSLSNREVTHPEDIDLTRMYILDIINEVKDSVHFEKRYLTKSGDTLWMDISISPIKDNAGKIIALVGAGSNITSRKKAEEDLRAAKEAADAANQAKSDFLARISHELRTPLNGILGLTQLLQRDPNFPHPYQSQINTISRSGEHLLKLINDVLDLAKIESGKFEQTVVPFSLSVLMKDVISINTSIAENKGLQLNYHETPGIPHSVKGDEKYLKQILINLIGNAVKFTQQGSVTLRVTDLYPGNKKVSLRFEVIDTGIGLEQSECDNIFQEFRQAGESEKKTEGTGLGLAISDRLVRLMGGQIKVKSELGKGSVFWFDIDLEKDDQKNWMGKNKKRRVTGVRGMPPKILVADDVPLNRFVVCSYLESIGISYIEATDGVEAVEQTLMHRPNAILMDWLMPGLDGYSAAKKIRQMNEINDIVIIALTANAFQNAYESAINAGCNDFLIKPVSLYELQEKLVKHLHFDWIYAD